MPLPPSGDPGEWRGEEFDDPFEEPVEFRPPLPPEDRIWRHPSEVAGTGAHASAAAPPPASRTRSGLALVVVSGLIGATLTVGVIAALGGFDSRTRVVERQRAVQPVTSLAADDDSVAAITSRTAPSVAGVYVTRGGGHTTGSAVVVRSDGHLLTNAHLVDGADRVEVRLNGQAVYGAEVVGSDAITDLAVLHVDADGLEPAAMGSAEQLRAGDAVLVLGHAHGTASDASVERSVVSELDQRVHARSGALLHGMILLDVSLPDGAIGGPLLDEAGAVVGLTSAAAADDDRARAVATPVDVVVHAAEQLIEHGRVRHVWLGIEGVDLRPRGAAELGVPGGASIKDVFADSPAADAGLEPGDVLIRVGPTPVSSMSEVIAALRTHEPGDTVDLTVRRGDDEIQTAAVLEEKTG